MLYDKLAQILVAFPAAQQISASRQDKKPVEVGAGFIEQANVDQIITACLARPGEVASLDAYDKGKKMTLEEAADYSLE